MIKKHDFGVDTPSNIFYKAETFLNARVAQLVEQWTENPRVGGSIPPPGTIRLH